MSENVSLWSICVCRASQVSTITILFILLQNTCEKLLGSPCLVGSSHFSNFLFNKNLKHHQSKSTRNKFLLVFLSFRISLAVFLLPTPSKNHRKVRPQMQTSWSEPYAKDVKHPGSSAGQLNKQTEHSVYHRRVGSQASS